MSPSRNQTSLQVGRRPRRSRTTQSDPPDLGLAQPWAKASSCKARTQKPGIRPNTPLLQPISRARSKGFPPHRPFHLQVYKLNPEREGAPSTTAEAQTKTRRCTAQEKTRLCSGIGHTLQTPPLLAGTQRALLPSSSKLLPFGQVIIEQRDVSRAGRSGRRDAAPDETHHRSPFLSGNSSASF